ncbi:hypothetical protein TSMEX_008742 [Taenia solium]|eukprot:TsM_000166100 transcript=TsM_000166100 gene=TsM_000166100
MKFSLTLVLCLLTGSHAFTTRGVLQQSLTTISSSFETTDSSALTSAVEVAAGETKGVAVEEAAKSTYVSVEITSKDSTIPLKPGTEPEPTAVSTEASETSKVQDSNELPEISKPLKSPENEVAHAEIALSILTEVSTPEKVEVGKDDFTSVSAEVSAKSDSTTKPLDVVMGCEPTTTDASLEPSMVSETTSKAVETLTSSLEVKTSTSEKSHGSEITSELVEVAFQDDLTSQPPEVEVVSKTTPIDTLAGSSTASEATSRPIETAVPTHEVKITTAEESGGGDITEFDLTTLTLEVGTERKFTSADTSSDSFTPFKATLEPVEMSTSTLEARITTTEGGGESEYTLTSSMVPEVISERDEMLVPFEEIESSAVVEGGGLIRALIVLYANELQLQKDAEKAEKIKDSLMKLVEFCYQYVESARQHECTPWLK